MKTTTITIGGRTFALAFTMDAMAAYEDTIPDFNLAKLTEYAGTAKGLLQLLPPLAQQGELLEGRALDVDRAWFGAHLRPSAKQLIALRVAVMDALAAGLGMETDDGGDEETDVVLEEIKKNDSPDA